MRAHQLIPVLGLVAACGSVASAQARVKKPKVTDVSARVIAPAGPRLLLEPKQPSGGELARLTVERLPAGDSVVAVDGELAGEPVHFIAASTDRRQALGAIPVDASDSVVARVFVARASGAVDTLHMALRYPHRPPAQSTPAISRRAAASGPARRLRVDPRFTSRMDAETQARWAWVILRHEIDYRRPLVPGEVARARTWVGEPKGPRFVRYVRIDGPDGEMCAQAASEWCLIDAETRRPARVPDWMAAPLR